MFVCEIDYDGCGVGVDEVGGIDGVVEICYVKVMYVVYGLSSMFGVFVY